MQAGSFKVYPKRNLVSIRTAATHYAMEWLKNPVPFAGRNLEGA